MDDNERNALRELQEDARVAGERPVDYSPTPGPLVQSFKFGAAVAVVLVLLATAYFASTDPCFGYKMEVTLHTGDPKALSMNCTQRDGRCTCNSLPKGFGCHDYCSANEPSLEILCGTMCTDPGPGGF